MTDQGDDHVEAAVSAYRDRFTAVCMFENSVFAGIPESLARMSARGARLFVATSKPQVFAEQILDHFELAQHFDAIHGSELDGRRSDKSELIAHVLHAEGLSAANTVMVGDRRHDVIGALMNRVFPTGVLWGYGSAEELTSAGAKRLFKAPADLIRFVN